MEDFGVKNFMVRLTEFGIGKEINGQMMNGNWFTGRIINMKVKFGVDVLVWVEDVNTAEQFQISGLDIAKGARYLNVEGLK